MLILTIRTDKPESEIGLYEDDRQLVDETWQAHRQLAETLHVKLLGLLKRQRKDWHDIEAVIAYRGPGSFTGLRIGLSVANALAAGLNVPVCGTNGDDWINKGLKALGQERPSKPVVPEYGGEVFITPPKK